MTVVLLLQAQVVMCSMADDCDSKLIARMDAFTLERMESGGVPRNPLWPSQNIEEAVVVEKQWLVFAKFEGRYHNGSVCCLAGE